MQTSETTDFRQRKNSSAFKGTLLSVILVPALAVLAALSWPCLIASRWVRDRREHRFRARMRAEGRFLLWQDFRRNMRESGGTCIEQRFSPKGPVRFWWTPENVYEESPFEIIDWFTMRKGGRFAPFISWCHQRYTSLDSGGALLVDTAGISRREIYTLWSECRSERRKARWIEVAPIEILPWRSDTVPVPADARNPAAD